MHHTVEPQDVEIAERGEKDEAGLWVAVEKSAAAEECGEPDLVGSLLVPPVIVEYVPVGRMQRGAVAAILG